SRFRKAGERCLRVEVEYTEPNSNRDERDYGGVNMAENGWGEAGGGFFSEKCPQARSHNYDGWFLARDFVGWKFAEKSRAGVHHRNKQAAAYGNAGRDFEDVDQQRNEDEISRAEKADENSCNKRT